MPNIIEYRTRGNTADPWSLWRTNTLGTDDVYFPRGTYVEMRIARMYTKGMVLASSDNGTRYEVLSDDIATEGMGGEIKQYVPCRARYSDGDWSPDFILKDTLDGYKVEGE